MSQLVWEGIDSSPNEPLYTISEAAKFCDITYQRMIYAIGKKWVVPCQELPVVLFTRSSLELYMRDFLDKEN